MASDKEKNQEELKEQLEMPLDEAIFEFIKFTRAGSLEIKNGIVYVTDGDGSKWDFTIPKEVGK